jgi:hypothetical protein
VKLKINQKRAADLVICVCDGRPLDLLLGVLSLLQLKDVLVEEVVQVLIRIVDAQLLKAVLLHKSIIMLILNLDNCKQFLNAIQLFWNVKSVL